MSRTPDVRQWWHAEPDGRTYQRRPADAAAGVASLSLIVVCGVLVAGGFGLAADKAVFHWINQWPSWLYPPMWTVQLSGVIGALPVMAAVAALFRRFRLAAALLAATLLKVSLEAVAKIFVQRGRPAEILPDAILHGKVAVHGLSFPSGHAIVIFAIAALAAPYVSRNWRTLLWALAVMVCVSRVYLGAHFPLDVMAGAGLGVFIASVLNLIFGVPQPKPEDWLLQPAGATAESPLQFS